MRLYLIRHAHALPHTNDAKRPLSERGRQTTLRLAELFRSNGAFTARQLWHSPLTRAFETAQILAETLDSDISLVETDGLCPSDDPADMVDRLTIYPTAQDIALVGHEPHLSALATLLVCGEPAPNAFHLKKNAVIMLRQTDKTHPSGLARWRIGWHLGPELLAAD